MQSVLFFLFFFCLNILNDLIMLIIHDGCSCNTIVEDNIKRNLNLHWLANAHFLLVELKILHIDK